MEGDQEYSVSWIILCYIVACCNFLAAALCLFASWTLIRSSSIRQNSFNIYVIFLIFPDGLQNITAGLGNVFFENRINIFPQAFYEIVVFVWFFYFLSNFYLNAVVAYEINILATASYRRQKTSPPKLRRAWKQVAMVYLFAIAISIWFLLPYKWSPMDIDDGPNGSLKYGSPNDGVFGAAATPLIGVGLIVIPITYVLYIRIRIACRKLLPKRGRTRVLSLFFMRIIIVFLLFYLPNTILTSFLVTLDHPVQSFWIAKVVTKLLNAFQAYVTLYMVMWKEDIRKVVATAWNDSVGKRCCCCCCCCCCCHIATTVPRRPSAMASRLTTSGRSMNDNTTSPSSSSRPPSLSASNGTEPSLPERSEWDEVDVYLEQRPADPDPTSTPEWDQEDVYRFDSSERRDIAQQPIQEEESQVETFQEALPSMDADLDNSGRQMV